MKGSVCVDGVRKIGDRGRCERLCDGKAGCTESDNVRS